MRRSGLVLLFATVLLAFAPASAIAHEDNSDPATYTLVMEAPNIGMASNGDTVEITCTTRQHVCGTWRTHPKGLPTPPSGEFVHKSPSGAVVAAGTWVATELITYDSYLCGVVLGMPIDPNACGGALKLRVVLMPTGTNLQLDGILTVFCIIGPNPPTNHDDPSEEGITLVVPGFVNFNHAAGGENVFIRSGA
jgi:hypothetical protein